MSEPITAAPSPAPQDENQLMAERRDKLKALRQAQAEGKGVAFPNDFKPPADFQKFEMPDMGAMNPFK